MKEKVIRMSTLKRNIAYLAEAIIIILASNKNYN